MTKCNQVNCEKDATHEYVWPTDGETKQSCEDHANHAKNVGAALGFTIKVKPITKE